VISLEQVHALEARVEKAVSYIATLRGENAELRRHAEEDKSFIDEASAELEAAESARGAAEARVAELERKVAETEAKAAELAARIDEYRRDQARIEEGIVHALEKLDSFEDLILGQVPPPSPRRESPPESSVPSEVATASTPSGQAESAAAPAGPENHGGDAELDIF